MLAMLKKEGAKDAELQSIGLAEFLQGRPSVTRDDLVQFIDENKIGLKESSYGTAIDNVQIKPLGYGDLPQGFGIVAREPQYRGGPMRERFIAGPFDTEDAAQGYLPQAIKDSGVQGNTKWHSYSLDPSNPTYRETVLHLPPGPFIPYETWLTNKASWGNSAVDSPDLRAEYDKIANAPDRTGQGDFRSGHFSEPNIIGHMMTSMVRHEGKPTYLIDQIQSDWGQAIRAVGVRDEGRVAELRAKVTASRENVESLKEQLQDAPIRPSLAQRAGLVKRETFEDIESKLRVAEGELRLLEAEYKTASSAVSDNPLVNTTDQWVNTTLRRALRQAAEAGDEYVAVPSGRTVLSYNPGDEAGMEGFYNSIVPKNLGNILKKLGVEDYRPALVPQLETPGKGMAGDGFSLFALPPEVRQSILDKGLPLFVNAPTGAIPGLAGTIFDDDDDLPVLRPLP